MNSNIWRIAAAAVIGLLLIVGGIAFLGGRQGGVGGSAATSAPATSVPSPTPGSTPTQTSSNLSPGQLCSAISCRGGTLDPGTYSFAASAVAPGLSFTVPAGWTVDLDGFVRKHAETADELFFSIWTLTHVQADVCHHPYGTLVDAGTTIDELANVLATQKGRVASAVTDVTVAGFPAKRIELTVPTDLDLTTCDFDAVKFWPDPGPDESGGLCCVALGSTDVVYAVDVAGQRPVVVARHQLSSTPEDLADLQAIVDSLVFEAPASSPSPSGASPTP